MPKTPKRERTTAERPAGPMVELDPLTPEKARALLPAMTTWARAEGVPDPSLADVIGLAVDHLTAQVISSTAAKVAQWRSEAEARENAPLH